jgi:chaperonin GroEL
MKEKKARVEDAMHATSAAVEEGIVPGGGVALLRAADAIESLKLEGDEKIGANIVRRALEEPLRQIVGNAGEEGAIVVGRIRDHKDSSFGYNAQTGQFEDLVKAGVIDPTKVTRTALQNAGSIASMMLTTEVLVPEIPKEHELGLGGEKGMGGCIRVSSTETITGRDSFPGIRNNPGKRLSGGLGRPNIGLVQPGRW